MLRMHAFIPYLPIATLAARTLADERLCARTHAPTWAQWASMWMCSPVPRTSMFRMCCMTWGTATASSMWRQAPRSRWRSVSWLNTSRSLWRASAVRGGERPSVRSHPQSLLDVRPGGRNVERRLGRPDRTHVPHAG